MTEAAGLSLGVACLALVPDLPVLADGLQPMISMWRECPSPLLRALARLHAPSRGDVTFDDGTSALLLTQSRPTPSGVCVRDVVATPTDAAGAATTLAVPPPSSGRWRSPESPTWPTAASTPCRVASANGCGSPPASASRPRCCSSTSPPPTSRRASASRAAVRVRLVLDSGALVALERNERPMWVRLKAAQMEGAPPLTHAGVLGQVWRGGPHQARLSQALSGIDVRALDEALARAAGQLLAAAGLSDVIDAAVVLLAADGHEIVTVDLEDIEQLAAASGCHVELVHP